MAQPAYFNAKKDTIYRAHFVVSAPKQVHGLESQLDVGPLVVVNSLHQNSAASNALMMTDSDLCVNFHVTKDTN